MVIPTIVTLAQLQAHLRLTPQTEGSPPTPVVDTDLQLKLDAATQIVCEYIADRNPADVDWIAEIESWTIGSPSAPPRIVLAVLEQASFAYRYRGDDPIQESGLEAGFLSPSVENLLSPYKNRAFA